MPRRSRACCRRTPTPFLGKIDQDIAVTFDKPGVYGVKCLPHYGMGMVALVVVGTPVNLDDAKAVSHPGKAKQVMAGLFDKLASHRPPRSDSREATVGSSTRSRHECSTNL